MIITNEVEPLSSDLTRLTTEIKTYQSIGGQAIFEIGRRLNWIKQKNLTHGEFGKWLSSIKLDQDTAERFMKIDSNLSNSDTYRNLGYQALYLIATMPAEERNKPQQLSSGETKKMEDMTVRELRETKRRLKQREKELSDKDAQIADQQAELEDNRKTQLELNNRLAEANKQQPEPKVITKTVTKEVPVKPDDYDDIKAKLDELKKQSAKDKEDIDYYKRELKAAERINKDANGYDKLQEQELKRKKRQAQIFVYDLSLDINDFLNEHNIMGKGLQTDRLDDEDKQALLNSTDAMQRFIDEIKNQLNNDRIIQEGEVIDNG